MMVDFTVTREEHALILEIAERAGRLAARARFRYELQDALMDITAAHCNGMPLRLADLLAADDADFGHDVFGIRRFIDRKTGQLGGCFVPRYAREQ